jgi:hypothetical protein
MEKPEIIMFFSNGNTIALDNRGQQIPEAQLSWLRYWVKAFLKNGGKLDDILNTKFIMPNKRVVSVYKVDEEDFNWKPKEI